MTDVDGVTGSGGRMQRAGQMGDEMNETAASEHGMVAGSHERVDGPECRCGLAWDWWGDRCSSLERSS